MMKHEGKSALEILGSPDDLKFRSSLTLFREAVSEQSDCELFTEALNQFYDGEPDTGTLELLRRVPLIKIDRAISVTHGRDIISTSKSDYRHAHL
jgi:hypothetical protein